MFSVILCVFRGFSILTSKLLVCHIWTWRHFHFYCKEFSPKSLSLREKCPYSDFFWSRLSHIRTEYGEIRSISMHSVRTPENTSQIKIPNTDTFHAVFLLKVLNFFQWCGTAILPYQSQKNALTIALLPLKTQHIALIPFSSSCNERTHCYLRLYVWIWSW